MIYARLLLLALVMIAPGADAQPRLVTPAELRSETMISYHADLRSVFTEAFDESVTLRALVLPSFSVEFVVGVRGRGDDHEIFVLTPTTQIWAFQSLAMVRSGEVAVFTFDEATEDNPLAGELQDGSQEEIARLEAELPDHPNQVPLTRCAIPISADAALTLAGAWRRMLDAVRSRDEMEVGLDGTTYSFSMGSGGRQLRGETWSPEPRTPAGRLARIAEAMRDYCLERREDALRSLLAAARELPG